MANSGVMITSDILKYHNHYKPNFFLDCNIEQIQGQTLVYVVALALGHLGAIAVLVIVVLVGFC